MKYLVSFVLLMATMLFVFFAINVLQGGQSAVHQILGWMCFGFAGLFVGQVGIMCAASEKAGK